MEGGSSQHFWRENFERSGKDKESLELVDGE
jgi:hypothetical protein